MERLLITLILVCTMNNITNAQNPFFGQYQTPHATVPFDRIKTEHYEPAILEGIKQQNAEIDAIILNPEKANFNNTIECILSASMSTLSSQFHTMGASVGSDIYGTYKPRSRGKLTNVIRLGVLFSILVSYIICYMLPNDIIARGTSIFMGICAAAFLPAAVHEWRVIAS